VQEDMLDEVVILNEPLDVSEVGRFVEVLLIVFGLLRVCIYISVSP
jgi:hypothetical protein